MIIFYKRVKRNKIRDLVMYRIREILMTQWYLRVLSPSWKINKVGMRNKSRMLIKPVQLSRTCINNKG
jgi:hypothetical protein